MATYKEIAEDWREVSEEICQLYYAAAEALERGGYETEAEREMLEELYRLFGNLVYCFD